METEKVERSKLPDTHPESMVELEKTIGLAAQDAIRAYNDAINAVKGKNCSNNLIQN